MKKISVTLVFFLSLLIVNAKKEIKTDYINYTSENKVLLQELNKSFEPINSVEKDVQVVCQLHSAKQMIFINYSGEISRFGIDEMKYDQGKLSYFASAIDSDEKIFVIIDEKKKVLLIQLNNSLLRIMYSF